MRQKSVNQKAVENTLAYLKGFQQKCEGTDFVDFTNTQLQTYFHISKSTYTACKDLGIIIEHDDHTEWNKQNPDRSMALLVLDNLLHRRKKKTSDVPILPDFVTPLNTIVEKLTNLSKNNFNRLETLKTPQKEVSLFSDQEKKDQQRFELLKAIATGAYSDAATLEKVENYKNLNQDIINITDHLLSLYNKK